MTDDGAAGDATGGGPAPGAGGRPGPPRALRPRVVLVTGPSGAGRSTAIAALEDAGFAAIDNLPLTLLERVLGGPAHDRPLALGLGTANRDFDASALAAAALRLQADPSLAAETLYLDCAPDALLRRYAETRRRHPMAPGEDPATGIAREAALLAPVRAAASMLIDTTALTPHELRAALRAAFAAGAGARLSVTLTSFSYKRGLPPGADTILDCRFLRNPHWEPSLRALDGRDPRAAAHVATDPAYPAFLDAALGLLRLTLPAQEAEGKAHLGIAFGCTGGRHRSVTLVEAVAGALAGDGYRVSKRHREMERGDAAAPGAASEAAPAPEGASGVERGTA